MPLCSACVRPDEQGDSVEFEGKKFAFSDHGGEEPLRLNLMNPALRL